jgi:hypothetical protein
VFFADNQIARHQRSLERAGLATTFSGQPTAEECGTPYLEHKEVIGIMLTTKGAAEKWPEHSEHGGGWDVVLGSRELVEVTAIVTESDLARAEFSSRLVPTVAGEALGQIALQQRASATFRRYDDGWRLVRIDNRPPRLREPLDGSPGRVP